MTAAELHFDDAAESRADLRERELAWLEPDRRPEPDRAAELADLADLRAVMDGGRDRDMVLECGDCRAVYRPDEHHECRQQARRNSRTCPTCKRPGVLTAREAARGYQCRACTRRDESAF